VLNNNLIIKEYINLIEKKIFSKLIFSIFKLINIYDKSNNLF
jgi:hypothetical protein